MQQLKRRFPAFLHQDGSRLSETHSSMTTGRNPTIETTHGDATLITSVATMDEDVTGRIVAMVDNTLKDFLRKLQPLEEAVGQLIKNNEAKRDDRLSYRDTLYDRTQRDNREETKINSTPSAISYRMDDKSIPPLLLERRRLVAEEVAVDSLGDDRHRSRPDLSSRIARNAYDRGRGVRQFNAEAVLLQVKKSKDIDYPKVLLELRKNIDPKTELGIDNLSIRKAASGGSLFHIRGKDAAENAELLAKRM